MFLMCASEDQVHYTENPADLNEYILNEYGCVFNGMAEYIGRKPWYYGQVQCTPRVSNPDKLILTLY